MTGRLFRRILSLRRNGLFRLERNLMPMDIGPMPETPYFLNGWKPVIDLSDTVHPREIPSRDWMCWFCDTYNPSVYHACSGCGAPYGATRRMRLRNSGALQARDSLYAVWI